MCRSHLLAVAALVSGLLVASYGGRSGSLAATAARGALSTVPTGPATSRAALSCAGNPCLAPRPFRVAYGIQPLLDRGIDGRGETVTVLVPVPGSADSPTDIRQDLKAFDSMFGQPAARLDIVNSLA